MNHCSLRSQDNKMRHWSNFQTLWNGRRRVFVRISLILARRGQTCQECPTCKNRHKTSFGILLSAYLEFRMTWHDELFEFRQQHERLRLGKISHRNRKRFVKKSKKSQFICSDNESSQLTWKIFLTFPLFPTLNQWRKIYWNSLLNWLFECCRHLLSSVQDSGVVEKRGGAAIYTDFNNGGLLEWIMRSEQLKKIIIIDFHFRFLFVFWCGFGKMSH